MTTPAQSSQDKKYPVEKHVLGLGSPLNRSPVHLTTEEMQKLQREQEERARLERLVQSRQQERERAIEAARRYQAQLQERQAQAQLREQLEREQRLQEEQRLAEEEARRKAAIAEEQRLELERQAQLRAEQERQEQELREIRRAESHARFVSALQAVQQARAQADLNRAEAIRRRAEAQLAARAQRAAVHSVQTAKPKSPEPNQSALSLRGLITPEAVASARMASPLNPTSYQKLKNGVGSTTPANSHEVSLSPSPSNPHGKQRPSSSTHRMIEKGTPRSTRSRVDNITDLYAKPFVGEKASQGDTQTSTIGVTPSKRSPPKDVSISPATPSPQQIRVERHISVYSSPLASAFASDLEDEPQPAESVPAPTVAKAKDVVVSELNSLTPPQADNEPEQPREALTMSSTTESLPVSSKEVKDEAIQVEVTESTDSTYESELSSAISSLKKHLSDSADSSSRARPRTRTPVLIRTEAVKTPAPADVLPYQLKMSSTQASLEDQPIQAAPHTPETPHSSHSLYASPFSAATTRTLSFTSPDTLSSVSMKSIFSPGEISVKLPATPGPAKNLTASLSALDNIITSLQALTQQSWLGVNPNEPSSGSTRALQSPSNQPNVSDGVDDKIIAKLEDLRHASRLTLVQSRTASHDNPPTSEPTFVSRDAEATGAQPSHGVGPSEGQQELEDTSFYAVSEVSQLDDDEVQPRPQQSDQDEIGLIPAILSPEKDEEKLCLSPQPTIQTEHAAEESNPVMRLQTQFEQAFTEDDSSNSDSGSGVRLVHDSTQAPQQAHVEDADRGADTKLDGNSAGDDDVDFDWVISEAMKLFGGKPSEVAKLLAQWGNRQTSFSKDSASSPSSKIAQTKRTPNKSSPRKQSVSSAKSLKRVHNLEDDFSLPAFNFEDEQPAVPGLIDSRATNPEQTPQSDLTSTGLPLLSLPLSLLPQANEVENRSAQHKSPTPGMLNSMSNVSPSKTSSQLLPSSSSSGTKVPPRLSFPPLLEEDELRDLRDSARRPVAELPDMARIRMLVRHHLARLKVRESNASDLEVAEQYIFGENPLLEDGAIGGQIREDSSEPVVEESDEEFEVGTGNIDSDDESAIYEELSHHDDDGEENLAHPKEARLKPSVTTRSQIHRPLASQQKRSTRPARKSLIYAYKPMPITPDAERMSLNRARKVASTYKSPRDVSPEHELATKMLRKYHSSRHPV